VFVIPIAVALAVAAGGADGSVLVLGPLVTYALPLVAMMAFWWEDWREGVPLNIIQRQLGHASLGTTSIYLQGIDPEEIIAAVRTRRAPMMSASAGLRL